MRVSRRSATFWLAYGICCTLLAGCATQRQRVANAQPDPNPPAPVVSPSPPPAVPSSPASSTTSPVDQSPEAPRLAVDPVVPVVVVPDKAPVPVAQPPSTRDLWHRIRLGSRCRISRPDSRRTARAGTKPARLFRAHDTALESAICFISSKRSSGATCRTELALLPFVESAFVPEASSSAKAAGLWQFIPSTGRDYDLEQTMWKDKRRDMVNRTCRARLSTEAVRHVR